MAQAWAFARSRRERRQADLFYADLLGLPTRRLGRDEALGEELDVDDPRRKSFRAMWDLVARYRWRETPALFTNEMIMAICWEESTFMNIWQLRRDGGKGPAKGFGQLEPSALALVRIKYGLKPTVADIQRLMDADAFSVSFIGRVLHTLHDNMIARTPALRSDPVRLKRGVLLYGYGGYATDHAQWRIEAINGWYSAERELLGGRGPSGYPTRAAAMRALDVGMPPSRRMRDRAAWQRFLASLCATLPDP